MTALHWLCAAWLALLGSLTSRATVESDVERLLEGVATVERAGVPGPVAVFGDKAFAILAGDAGGGVQAAVIAAGRLGGGRVLAFGHNGYGAAAKGKPGETALLMRNVLTWTAKSKAKSLRAGALGGAFAALLRDMGFEVVELPRGPRPDGVDKLALIACSPLSLSEEEAGWLGAYASGGGGLVCGDCPWGWQQLNPASRIVDRPGQALLAKAGLAYADGYIDATGPNGSFTAVPPSPLTNAARALELLIAAESGKAAENAAQFAQAQHALQLALRWMPEGENAFREQLERMVKQREAQLAPTSLRPLRRKDALARALLAVQIEMLRRTPVSKLRAHAAATDFPGDVEAPAQLLQVEIDSSLGGWHSTGAYARPGARIEVQLPGEAAARGFAVRIGCHSDSLWQLDDWQRVPEITRESPVLERVTLAANPFGGPVYVVAPDGCTLGRVKVQIRGAIPAPLYVLGETSLEEWRGSLRARPAPWAELASRKLAISVPSSVVRTLDDPQALMQFWERVLDAQAELVGVALARPRAERFVCDRQISAGYMHSGYPIMMGLDVPELLVSLERLERGDQIWGPVHELGHNLQRGEWTFEGTGEVTNNLIAVYSIERCCTLPPGQRGHPAADAPPSVADYIARGAKFEEWKSSPFLALAMYLQLRDAFGWEPFQKVFREYLALDPRARPKSDDEKRDQWLVRMSQATGKNLGRFFETWGVPTSPSARRSVETLPEWMPGGLAPKKP